MAPATTASDDFVIQLFDKVAYQPDDEVAKRALETELHADFTATINEVEYSREAIIKLFLDGRKKETYTCVESKQLMTSPPNEDGEVESMGHIQTFEARSKEDGKSSYKVESVTICRLKVVGGRTQLLQLSEVTRPVV